MTTMTELVRPKKSGRFPFFFLFLKAELAFTNKQTITSGIAKKNPTFSFADFGKLKISRLFLVGRPHRSAARK